MNNQKPPGLTLIKTTFKITNSASPFFGRTIYVDEKNFHHRCVLKRFCSVTLNNGEMCPCLQTANVGYCSRHLKSLGKPAKLPLPDRITLQESNEQYKGQLKHKNVANQRDTYILVFLCKADTGTGSMCNNLPNAMRGYCYTHYGMIQRGSLIEPVETSEAVNSEELSESESD